MGQRVSDSLFDSNAYFFPMQALGPTKNGWLASFVSDESGSSQRSGLNFIGSAKYWGSCVTVHELVYISV